VHWPARLAVHFVSMQCACILVSSVPVKCFTGSFMVSVTDSSAPMQRVRLTSSEVVIKVNSRQVLQAITSECGVSDRLFGNVCVVLDKIEKLPREEVCFALWDWPTCDLHCSCC
jgi:hypothetical protein